MQVQDAVSSAYTGHSDILKASAWLS